MVKKLTSEIIADPIRWDAFNAISPQGSVFSSTTWMESASSAHGGAPVCLGVVKDGVLAAGVSFVALKKGPFAKATSPVLTPFGGMLYLPDPGKRHSEAESFNNECARVLIGEIDRRYSHAFLVHAPSMNDIRPFLWHGWREKVKYTYTIDISDPDKLWDMIERRVRTVIRNAESSLVLGGRIPLNDFAELYERIYRDRDSALPLPSSSVASMAGRILDSGLGEMRTVADKTGAVLSAMIVVPDAISGCVYAWISGSIPGENSSGAFSLLFWDTVRRYTGTLGRLDMVGANIESIAFFKKGFGGTLTPYYVTEHFSSLFSRLAMDMYGRIRSFVR